MPMISAQEAVDKWSRNTKNAQQDYVAGINRVTEAPGQKAAAAMDAYLQGVQAAANKWRNNVGAVTLEDWRSKAVQKGAPRISAGVDAAMDKTLRATERNFANIEAVLSSLPARGSFQDNVQRSVAFMTGMHDRSNR